MAAKDRVSNEKKNLNRLAGEFLVASRLAQRGRWVLQSKYANPRSDAIPLEKRFVCCVDISSKEREPSVHVFPAQSVSTGLHYYFNSKFSDERELSPLTGF